MKEYIEKDKPLSLLKNYLNKPNGQYNAQEVVYLVDDLISDIPAADVVEVRHGRWETVMLDHERMGCRPTAHYCSECHQITWFRTFYCPNCGAKMDGGVNDGKAD